MNLRVSAPRNLINSLFQEGYDNLRIIEGVAAAAAAAGASAQAVTLRRLPAQM